MDMKRNLSIWVLCGVSLLCAGLSLAWAQSPTPANLGPARFTVQYSAFQNKPLYFITDNAADKLHIYENGPKGCVLRQSIDLSQVGQAELVATSPERTAMKPEQSVLR
jgi:hypothetical protein